MLLELKHIYKNYLQDKIVIPVLKDVNISIDEGEYVAIMGPSGSGKTTLMNTISGLDNFSDGIIEVDGKKITKFGSKIQEQVRNEKFGYIFQNYYLLMDRTVEYNLQLGLSLYNLSDQEKEERIDYERRKSLPGFIAG